jgi:hypothetical protein
MIDNLGGRLGSFDRLERELPAGESWSGFDRALSGSAYFGPRAEAPELNGQAPDPQSNGQASGAPDSNGHSANGHAALASQNGAASGDLLPEGQLANGQLIVDPAVDGDKRAA